MKARSFIYKRKFTVSLFQRHCYFIVVQGMGGQLFLSAGDYCLGEGYDPWITWV